MDSFRITDVSKNVREKIQGAQNDFRQTVTKSNGRDEVALPWTHKAEYHHDNPGRVVKRLAELDEERGKEQLVLHVNELMLPRMDVGRYSRLSRLLRVTAWVKRFVANCRVSGTYRRFLTAEEEANAELYWVKLSQREDFAKEMLLANQSF